MTLPLSHADGLEPLISVILPVYNGATSIQRVLDNIRASNFASFEILVIDDASHDETPAIIQKAGQHVRLIRNQHNFGPYHSRNEGARLARGKILFFTDADVLIQPDTLSKIWRHFSVAERAAVIGLYQLPPPQSNIASLYKHSWIRFSYLNAPERVNWFFTAVGAIRRDVWEQSGNFNPAYSRKTGGGDIEFGQRLASQGFEIFLDKTLEVEHLKHYTLGALLRNDGCRAYGWSCLALRSISAGWCMAHGLANVTTPFVMSVGGTGLIMLGAVVALWYPRLAWLSGGLTLFYLAINFPFYRYLCRQFDLKRTIACVPVMFFDHACCGLGIAISLLRHATRRLFGRLSRRIQPGQAGRG
jgi:glycosyltransferase involved in cell wall biosynthesis